MGTYITDYFLYRKRFLLGYSLIAISVGIILYLIGTTIPGGLTEGEMESVVQSSQLSFNSFTPESIINLPYHIVQKGSLSILGVSVFSIKLPSLILGALSAVGLLLLLQTWFKRNVAIITTLIIIATGQFLFVSQNGTPTIMYIFWTVWLLLAAMMVSRHAAWQPFWKIILFAAAALSLYTPLSVYILVALVAASVLHPHLRFLMRRLSKPMLALAAFCGLVLVAPLIRSLIMQPSIGLTLLGIPNQWPQFDSNMLQILSQYFNFAMPGGSSLMTPIYGLGSVIFIGLGLWQLFTTKYTARSYIITIWLVLLLPILIINPNFISITFVPFMLLIGMGVNILLANWYQMFPRNPYARIAGLVPLAVLIGGMVFSGLDRYMYGYQYNPAVAVNFSHDLPILNKEIATLGNSPSTLVATPQSMPFYQAVYRDKKELTITTTTPSKPTSAVIVMNGVAKRPAGVPNKIVTNGFSDHSDRFYIYKSEVK